MTARPNLARYFAMLRDLANEVVDLHELAAKHGMSRLEMAKWAARPRHSAMIDSLERLARRRAALLVATQSADAVLALGRISRNEQPDARDVSRKACLDLIRLGARGPDPHAPGAPELSTAAACETRLRESMAALARESDLEELQEVDDEATHEDDEGAGAD